MFLSPDNMSDFVTLENPSKKFWKAYEMLLSDLHVIQLSWKPLHDNKTKARICNDEWK